MAQQFEAILTGSDSQIEGVVNSVIHDGGTEAYEFRSLDDSLHLIIAKDAEGNWERIGGSEPYFSGWVDELAEQIKLASSGNNTL